MIGRLLVTIKPNFESNRIRTQNLKEDVLEGGGGMLGIPHFREILTSADPEISAQERCDVSGRKLSKALCYGEGNERPCLFDRLGQMKSPLEEYATQGRRKGRIKRAYSRVN